MAFAICVGAVVVRDGDAVRQSHAAAAGGDRIVHLRNWDVQANDPEPRALHDFVVWRQAMRSVADLGAWEDVTRNLKGRDGEGRPVQIASITASGFRVAATPPLLGRALLPADEQPGAPPVVVLGHDVWQARFGGDSAIIGRAVQLGDAYATVVGVMPNGFTFPIAHDAWTPFRPNALDDARGGDPASPFCAARARCDARRRGGGARGARPARGARASRHARAPAASGDAVRADDRRRLDGDESSGSSC
jgi:hypothetical protein